MKCLRKTNKNQSKKSFKKVNSGSPVVKTARPLRWREFNTWSGKLRSLMPHSTVRKKKKKRLTPTKVPTSYKRQSQYSNPVNLTPELVTLISFLKH